MKTTKLILLLISTLFCLSNANAQSHDMSPGSTCKLIKTHVNSESAVCPACAAKDKKEKDAKLAEDNRRNQVIWDKAKADKIASDKAWKEKQLEDAKNAHSGEVLINMPKNTVTTKNSAQPKTAKNVTDNTIMIGTNVNLQTYPQVFKNEKDEVILQNKDWATTQTFSAISMSEICVKNLGVVKIGDANFYFKPYTYRYDLVNSKGDYLFNDNTIKSINHLNDGWLLIGNFDSQNYFLYNLNTKNKIVLDNITTEHYRDGQALDLFLPIFPETIKLAGPEHRAGYSERVKNNIFKWASSKISEEILSKYSFALVHTNYGTAVNYAGNERQRREYDNSSMVVLYCVTENGELTKINLK